MTCWIFSGFCRALLIQLARPKSTSMRSVPTDRSDRRVSIRSSVWPGLGAGTSVSEVSPDDRFCRICFIGLVISLL